MCLASNEVRRAKRRRRKRQGPRELKTLPDPPEAGAGVWRIPCGGGFRVLRK